MSPDSHVDVLDVSLLCAAVLKGGLAVGTLDKDVLVLGPSVLVKAAQVGRPVVTAVAAIAQLLVHHLHVPLQHVRPLGLTQDLVLVSTVPAMKAYTDL
jgi:hypothetical protein